MSSTRNRRFGSRDRGHKGRSNRYRSPFVRRLRSLLGDVRIVVDRMSSGLGIHIDQPPSWLLSGVPMAELVPIERRDHRALLVFSGPPRVARERILETVELLSEQARAKAVTDELLGAPPDEAQSLSA